MARGGGQPFHSRRPGQEASLLAVRRSPRRQSFNSLAEALIGFFESAAGDSFSASLFGRPGVGRTCVWVVTTGRLQS